jgi:anti-sigma B factor antagonist
MPEEFATKLFRCKTERRGETIYVRPRGELDLRTVPELDDALARARADARHVVLDLRGLSFMDSTGISLVTRWNLEARRDGFEFALIQGDERVRRLFELTALTGYFTFMEG